MRVSKLMRDRQSFLRRRKMPGLHECLCHQDILARAGNKTQDLDPE